jgi:hypothetical protein
MHRAARGNGGAGRDECLRQHLTAKDAIVGHPDARAHERIFRTRLGAERERLQQGGHTVVHGTPLDGGNDSLASLGSNG